MCDEYYEDFDCCPNCGKDVDIEPGEVIQCPYCGYIFGLAASLDYDEDDEY